MMAAHGEIEIRQEQLLAEGARLGEEFGPSRDPARRRRHRGGPPPGQPPLAPDSRRPARRAGGSEPGLDEWFLILLPAARLAHAAALACGCARVIRVTRVSGVTSRVTAARHRDGDGCDSVHKRVCTLSHPYIAGLAGRAGCAGTVAR